MKNDSLNKVINQSPLMTFKEDPFWPISDQFCGIEIEIENFSNRELDEHIHRGSPFWVTHDDHSLRNGIEYVLSQPMMGAQLREAIDYFYNNITKFTISPRTSIHVHFNMRQEYETIGGLRNLVVLYYMFEESFFRIADETRKWNGYCNPFEDTPPQILEDIMTYEEVKELSYALRKSAAVNENRYYGLNLNALTRYGTVEFRHLPLVADRKRLVDWVCLLQEFKKAAGKITEAGLTPVDVFKSPADIQKLRDYMPLFAEQLLAYADPVKVFGRMANVNGLSLPKQRAVGGLAKNAAWTRFLEKQNKPLEPDIAAPKKAPTRKRGNAGVIGQWLEDNRPRVGGANPTVVMDDPLLNRLADPPPLNELGVQAQEADVFEERARVAEIVNRMQANLANANPMNVAAEWDAIQQRAQQQQNFQNLARDAGVRVRPIIND